MIAVEQLFAKPIPEIIKEQQNLQREITTRNKELKDLFSSKYHELLNCTDLLNGISDYTIQIITITNQTQQNMMQINEQNTIMAKPKRDHKPKSYSYFLKKIKQAIKKGYLYNAQIALMYLQQKYQLNDYEKLYPIIILDQIASEVNLTNIVDATLVHQDNLDYFFKHLIEFGSQNCQNFDIIIEKINEIEVTQNYKELIMLKTEFINLSIDEIYQLLTKNILPQLQIDDDLIQSFQAKILQRTQQLTATILNTLMSNIVIKNQFNHDLYQQIQGHKQIIDQETKNKAIQIWQDWFSSSIKEQFDQQKALLSQQQIKTENDFQQLYSAYMNNLQILRKSIDNLNQLPYKEIEYKNELCFQYINERFIELNSIFNQIFESERNSFIICFYYNILLFQQNELFQQNQIQLYQEHNQQWNLKEIDQLLISLYKLQNQEIKRDQISQIIKLMLQQVDIQFSIEYRNLATAIHPEKAQEFYSNLFREGKFNNKQLKRLQLNFENNEQFESSFTYYTFQQKVAPKDSINAWATKAQEVQPKQEQQSRFGLNMFWKKQ